MTRAWRQGTTGWTQSWRKWRLAENHEDQFPFARGETTVSKLKELVVAVVAGLIAPAFTLGDEPARGAPAVQGRYAAVNGLKMYYEIHGIGRPLVYLHGSFGWAAVPPALLEGRQVIAVEDRKSTRLNSSHLGISY